MSRRMIKGMQIFQWIISTALLVVYFSILLWEKVEGETFPRQLLIFLNRLTNTETKIGTQNWLASEPWFLSTVWYRLIPPTSSHGEYSLLSLCENLIFSSAFNLFCPKWGLGSFSYPFLFIASFHLFSEKFSTTLGISKICYTNVLGFSLMYYIDTHLKYHNLQQVISSLQLVGQI